MQKARPWSSSPTDRCAGSRPPEPAPPRLLLLVAIAGSRDSPHVGQGRAGWNASAGRPRPRKEAGGRAPGRRTGQDGFYGRHASSVVAPSACGRWRAPTRVLARHFGLRPGLDRPVHDFLTRQSAGVLATTRPDGNVRQSVVYFALDGDRLLISTEPGRAKAKDVQRTGRASLCVIGGASPYPSVTLEGPARIHHRHARLRRQLPRPGGARMSGRIDVHQHMGPEPYARTDSLPGAHTRPPARRPSCPKPCRRSSARGRTHEFEVTLMTAGREDLIEYRSGGKSRRLASTLPLAWRNVASLTFSTCCRCAIDLLRGDGVEWPGGSVEGADDDARRRRPPSTPAATPWSTPPNWSGSTRTSGIRASTTWTTPWPRTSGAPRTR